MSAGSATRPVSCRTLKLQPPSAPLHFDTFAKLPRSKPPDQVFVDIANYVHDYKVDSPLAWDTAVWCLQDTLGCGLEALRTSEQWSDFSPVLKIIFLAHRLSILYSRRLMGPVVPGTVVPNGSRVPGDTTSREYLFFFPSLNS